MKISPQQYYYTQALIEFECAVILTRGYKYHGEKYILPYLIYYSPLDLVKLRIKDLDDYHLINNINHYKKIQMMNQKRIVKYLLMFYLKDVLLRYKKLKIKLKIK